METKILSLGVASIICICTPVQAQAADENVANSTQNTTADVVPYAEWLITDYSLICSGSSKTLYITSRTSSSAEMKEIGLKDVIVQRSSDNANWIDDVNVGDKTTTSASTYSLANYPVSVTGGYYYRVKLTHYAKESGLFGSSQSVENTSNSVWID